MIIIYVNFPTRNSNVPTALYYYFNQTQVVGSVGAGTSENHKSAAGKARKIDIFREERFTQRNQKGHNGLQGE